MSRSNGQIKIVNVNNGLGGWKESIFARQFCNATRITKHLCVSFFDFVSEDSSSFCAILIRWLSFLFLFSFSLFSFSFHLAWSTAVTNEFHIINCQKGNMSKAGCKRRIADIYKGLLHLSLSLSYFRGLAGSHLIWEALSLIAPANGTNRREGREERWKDKMSERCADRGKRNADNVGCFVSCVHAVFLVSFYS